MHSSFSGSLQPTHAQSTSQTWNVRGSIVLPEPVEPPAGLLLPVEAPAELLLPVVPLLPVAPLPVACVGSPPLPLPALAEAPPAPPVPSMTSFEQPAIAAQTRRARGIELRFDIGRA